MPGVSELDRKPGQPTVFGDVPVGAGETEAVVREVGATRPDLRAVEQPTVSVARRACPHPGQVRPCVWLGEELAPRQRFAAQYRRGMFGQKSRTGMHQNGGPDNSKSSHYLIGEPETRGLFVKNTLMVAREALSLVLFGPADPRVACVEELPLEFSLAGPILGGIMGDVGRWPVLSFQVRLDPRTRRAPVLDQLIHL